MPETLSVPIRQAINISNVVPISGYGRIGRPDYGCIPNRRTPGIGRRSGLTPHLGNQCLVVS